jgi:hypothetical protein
MNLESIDWRHCSGIWEFWRWDPLKIRKSAHFCAGAAYGFGLA